jgi:hypothetical protein
MTEGVRRTVACAAAAMALPLASVALAPSAQATTFKTDCAHLESYLDGTEPVGDGDFVQLAETCHNESYSITNTHAFTLEGDGNPATGFDGSTSPNPILRTSEPVRLTITKLAFSHGVEEGGFGGGAISVRNAAGAAPRITHDTFSANKAEGNTCGGAIQVDTLSSPTAPATVIEENMFTGNSAGTCGGGAVWFDGSSPITLTNNTLTGNSSGSAGGAALLSNGFGATSNAITLEGNVVGGTDPGAGNSAVYAAGGVHAFPAATQPVVVRHNAFLGNRLSGTAPGGFDRIGGGLVVFAGNGAATVSQEGNLFSGNLITTTGTGTSPVPNAGGGGEWLVGVTASASRDEFIGNRVAAPGGNVDEGGGLGIEGYSASAPASFIGSDELFLANSLMAGGWGGAIYSGVLQSCTSPDCPSHLTLLDSTVSGNSVDAGAGSEGGAVWGSADDTLAVANSILYGNPSGPGQPDVFGFGEPSFQYTDGCTAPGSPTPLPGAGNICAAPLLGAGGVETTSSPTVDAGSNALVPGGLATDLAESPRIFAGRCGATATVDMGAFELATPGCTPPPAAGGGGGSTPSVGKLKVGAIIGTTGSLTMTVSCAGGAASQLCSGDATLSTVEHLLGKRVASLSKLKQRKRTVVVGHRHFSLHAGQSLKLVIPLNKIGSSLLRRFHKLPIKIVVSVRTATGTAVVSGLRATIKAPRKHSKHRR